MDPTIDIKKVKIIRNIILSGIQRGFFDYESLKLVCGEKYDQILQILSRPFTNMIEVENLASLVEIDMEKYGVSGSDILLYHTPNVIEPLMGDEFAQHVENPVLFYVSKDDKVKVIDGDSNCDLHVGFYSLVPAKNTLVIFNSKCKRLIGKSVSFTLKKVNPMVTQRNKMRIPKHPDEKFVPTPRTVLLTRDVSDLDFGVCIPIGEGMYYICSEDCPVVRQNVSLPFHQVLDHTYEEKLVAKLNKMFAVEWISDALSSHCEGSECVKTSDIFKMSDIDLASLKILLAGEATYEENSRIVMKNNTIKEFIAQFRQQIRSSTK